MFKFLRRLFASKKNEEVEALKIRVAALENEIVLLKSKR